MKSFRVILGCCALSACVGCNSYSIVQTSHFVNDDGAIVCVGYGRAEGEHTSTFISPTNGRELEFKTKLVVDVSLPDWPEGVRPPEGGVPFDGDDFTAWQCMNFSGNGTMYKTDDGEWYFLASGFTCKIARRDAQRPTLYRDVFSGVLCNVPEKKVEKDERWRKVRPSLQNTRRVR